MRDERLDRLADLLLKYSLKLQPGELFEINGGVPAKPLIKALQKRAHAIGAVPFVKLVDDESPVSSSASSTRSILKNPSPPSTRSSNGKPSTGITWWRMLISAWTKTTRNSPPWTRAL
jgi:leucyl aminopeptidase (aminopeptidase T)